MAELYEFDRRAAEAFERTASAFDQMAISFGRIATALATLVEMEQEAQRKSEATRLQMADDLARQERERQDWRERNPG